MVSCRVHFRLMQHPSSLQLVVQVTINNIEDRLNTSTPLVSRCNNIDLLLLNSLADHAVLQCIERIS